MMDGSIYYYTFLSLLKKSKMDISLVEVIYGGLFCTDFVLIKKKIIIIIL
jgi:hypothetical protein